MSPDARNANILDAARGMAGELERMALFMGLPMLRTERALLDARVDVWQEPEAGDDEETPGLTEDARRVIAERLVELLTQH